MQHTNPIQPLRSAPKYLKRRCQILAGSVIEVLEEIVLKEKSVVKSQQRARRWSNSTEATEIFDFIGLKSPTARRDIVDDLVQICHEGNGVLHRRAVFDAFTNTADQGSVLAS